MTNGVIFHKDLFPRSNKFPETEPGESNLTHSQLVDVAEKYLRKRLNLKVVFKELVSCSREIPDAIGFDATYSYLVECKASRSDFLSDCKKPFRQNPAQGMGALRFYLCPKGLIKPEEVPEYWGLIYTDGVNYKTIKKAEKQKRSEKNEMSIMYSALRRMAGHNVLNKVYEQY